MSLQATAIQDIRLRSRLGKNEQILRQFGALDLFVDHYGRNTLISADRKREILGSIGKTVQFPVLKYNGDVQVSNSRSCVISAGENTSALAQVTFVTYFVGVQQTPSLFMNNSISQAEDLEKKIKDATRSLMNKMDQDAIAALAAAKTQVFNENLLYQTTGNEIQVPFLQKQDILGDLHAIMSANGFDERLHIVGDFALQAMVAKLAQWGPANMVNKQLEYLGKSFWTSKNIAKTSGAFSKFYAVADGNLDLAVRVDREAFLGTEAAGHEWAIVRLPELDIPVGMHYYEEVGNQSAIAGDASADMTCVATKKWGFSVDVAYITPYNSDPTTIPSAITAAEVAGGTATGLPVYVTGGTVETTTP